MDGINKTSQKIRMTTHTIFPKYYKRFMMFVHLSVLKVLREENSVKVNVVSECGELTSPVKSTPTGACNKHVCICII